MTRNLIWFMAGAIALALAVGIGGFIFLRTGASGFSARSEPSRIETFAAEQARRMAMPAGAKHQSNPVPMSKDVLDDAMAHWADHCAVCHSNDGSGQVEMGRGMYPHAPDMRQKQTQDLTDGELFYIIENGIRLSGMPGWSGSAHGEEDSWKLVHFIRHLPNLTAAEVERMEKLNPKSPAEIEEERQEQEFLNRQKPTETPVAHKHH